MSARNFFNKQEKEQLENAIKEAEQNTSGEIRLHVENRCREDLMDHAAYIFEELEMHKTKLRNGVLIYMAIEDRELAILGDAGINSKVPQGFWDDIMEHVISRFKEQKFADGLSEGIKMAGKQLKKYFPRNKDDKNELSDDISFGNKSAE